MKKLIPIIAICLLSFASFSQTPNYSWAQKAGGTNTDEGRKLVVDDAGNTYVIGECRSTPVNFGTIVIPSAYNNFIVKYSPTGTVLWAKKAGISLGSGATNTITNIELDAVGNIYIIGGFAGNLVVGNDTITSIGFGGNLYIAKYNSSGIGLWAKNKTLTAANQLNNLDIRNMKRVNASSFVVIGYSQFTDTIENIINLKYPSYFIATIDTSGVFTNGYSLVVDTLATSPYTFFEDIATNSRGNIYLSGGYYTYNTEIDTTHWNLPPNTTYKKSYIAKFDNNLNFQWVKTNDYSPNPYWCNCSNNAGYCLVTADDEDNVYQTGEYWADTMYYDNFQVYGWNAIGHDFSTFLAGSGDIYVVKLNGAGVTQWLKSYTSNNDEYPKGICSDKLSNVYITGVCVGSTSFDGLTTGNAAYYSPLFVTKVTSTGNVAWLQGASNCNVYSKTIGEDGKGNVIIAGGYYGTCDPDFGSFNLVHYSPLANTGPEDMFTAHIGNCNLTAPTISTSSALTWCGNDSVVLTASSTAQNYLWNTGDTTQSIVANTSGDFNVFCFDSLGCYAKSITITTIVNPLPNIGVTQNATTLTAQQNGATYQWIDCTNNTVITGATDQSFTASSNGNYAVVVSTNSCSDTSACVSITTVSINEINSNVNIGIFPNPFTSQTTISFSKEQRNTTIKINDVVGKEIKVILFSGKEFILEKCEMKTGIYFMQIADGKKNVVIKKLIIQ